MLNVFYIFFNSEADRDHSTHVYFLQGHKVEFGVGN